MFNELVAFFRDIQTFDMVILGIAGVIWLLLLLFNVLFWLRLAFKRTPALGAATVPVTVILVERNEEENLRKNLPGWLSLGYPEYEVLVVDDFSEDNSFIVVGMLKQQHFRLRLTGLNQETRYSGKLSRNLGLKAASNDKVVFITPDMVPPDNHWLPGIATAFAREKEMVVGYTRLSPLRGFYHLLYRIESFFQQTESMAYCLNGLPFVSTEENISFSRNIYFAINGFAGKIGEDYLNMEMIYNQIIRRKNNAILLAGNLSMEKDMKAGRQDFRDLYYRSYLLKDYLRMGTRALRWFVDWLKILYLPVFVVCVVLYMPLWPVITALFVLLAIIRIIYLKRLQNRLHERGIFVTSLLYGMLIPYIRIFTNWRYRYKRRNP